MCLFVRLSGLLARLGVIRPQQGRSAPSSSLPEPSRNSSLLGFQPRVATFAWRTSPNATTGVEPGTTRVPEGGHCVIRAEMYSGISIRGMGSNCGADGWSEPVPERELHPSPARFHGALLHQLLRGALCILRSSRSLATIKPPRCGSGSTECWHRSYAQI